MNLEEWLHIIESRHTKKIDLSLDRIRQVAKRLQLLTWDCPVVTIAGTNGKGSCVAFLEAIYRAEGYCVGSYTSPHVLRFNERIKIDGQAITDEDCSEAFETIERSRGETGLTYFEFATLAALLHFKHRKVDVMLLEVGMGGIFDAVNIIEPSVSVITSIGLDHQQWLGDTREAIAKNKAGIMRKNVPVIYGETDMPNAIDEQSVCLSAPLFQLGRDFRLECGKEYWRWVCAKHCFDDLPYPNLDMSAAANALMAITCLKKTLFVSEASLKQGLSAASLQGRFQVIHQGITTVLDVAHNPPAFKNLREKIISRYPNSRVHAVIGMLDDKAIKQCLDIIEPIVVKWYPVDLPDEPRAASAQQIAMLLEQSTIYPNVQNAYLAACQSINSDAIILITGSFVTVSEGLKSL